MVMSNNDFNTLKNGELLQLLLKSYFDSQTRVFSFGWSPERAWEYYGPLYLEVLNRMSASIGNNKL